MTIIISAYAIYPFIKSSEGIVNKNWIDILRQFNYNVVEFSSEKSAKILKSNKIVCYRNGFLSFIYFLIKLPKRNFLGFFYKLLNAFYLKINTKSNSLYQDIWIKVQTNKLCKITNTELNKSIFWARILPEFSIVPILIIYNKKKIPFVVNINDPIEHESNDSNYLNQTKDIAQCWTFPSKRLLNCVANQYNLDLKRCFVIPHAMLKQTKVYQGKNKLNLKLKFVYCGTFYKSAFSDDFSNELIKFSNSNEYVYVEFTFILSQYDDDAIKWLIKYIPNVKILTKLNRDEVIKLSAAADCLLIIDAPGHKELLKGKLIEAISLGLPILAVTYQNSLMDCLVKEYGGISAFQNQVDDISIKFKQMVYNLNNDKWISDFIEIRKNVMDKISEENILKATIEISQYAIDRHNWLENKNRIEPIAPTNYNWP